MEVQSRKLSLAVAADVDVFVAIASEAVDEREARLFPLACFVGRSAVMMLAISGLCAA